MTWGVTVYYSDDSGNKPEVLYITYLSNLVKALEKIQRDYVIKLIIEKIK